MLCAVNQAAYLLKRQLESQGQEFLKSGGFSEKLYAARRQSRTSDRSDTSDESDTKCQPDAPACPRCGKPMFLRTAHRGPHAGKEFWGCSSYPDCRGILAARSCSPPNQSDQSDKSDGL